MKDSTTARLVDEVVYTLISVFTNVHMDAIADNEPLVRLYKEFISADSFSNINAASASAVRGSPP